MGLPGVLDFNRELPPPDRSFWKILEQPASAALRGLLRMRASEGRGVCKDIRDRVRHIKELVREIKSRIPKATAAYARRLRDRINTLMAGDGPDLEASELAVHFSKARNAARADVHVVPIKQVKKPKGAKRGLVWVTGGRTLHLRREEARLRRILDARIDD